MADDYADLMTEQAALARRQKLLDALQQQGHAPIQGNSTLSRIVQVLANVGGAGFGAMQQPGQDAAANASQSKYGDALSAQMAQYMQKQQGAPAVAPTATQGNLMEGDPNQITAPGTPAVAPDPRGAVVAALASRFPEMKQLGLSGMQNLQKADQPEKFGAPVEGMWQGKPAMLIHGDKGTVRPVEGATPLVKGVATSAGQSIRSPIDGTVISAGVPMEAPKMGSAFGFTGDAAKDLYQQHPDGSVHKLDNAPRTNVKVTGPTISMGAGQKAGYEDAFKQGSKVVAELGEKARSATAQNSTLAQMQALSDAGTVSGPTAQGAIKLGQLAKSLGIDFKADQLTNSQTYNALATRVWQQQISQAGGNKGITSAEAEQLRNLSPELATTPQGRKQISAVLKNINDRQISDYRKSNDAYKQALQTQDPTKLDFGGVMLPDTSEVPIVPGAGQSTGGPIIKGWGKQ